MVTLTKVISLAPKILKQLLSPYSHSVFEILSQSYLRAFLFLVSPKQVFILSAPGPQPDPASVNSQ